MGFAREQGRLPQHDEHYLAVRLDRSQETLVTSLSAVDLPPRFEEHGYAMLVADGMGEGGAGSVANLLGQYQIPAG